MTKDKTKKYLLGVASTIVAALFIRLAVYPLNSIESRLATLESKMAAYATQVNQASTETMALIYSLQVDNAILKERTSENRKDIERLEGR